jgi:beta-lactamase superfamily II metal-dependent hydrolase
MPLHGKRHSPGLTVAILLWPALAVFGQELFYLPLQRPGQASISIDRKNHTAIVVDLGKDKEGAELLLDGKPLLDRLEELQIKRLIFSCSHPHADHMGGIQALFRNPQQFFQDKAMTRARFDSLTFIDDGVAQPLYAIFKAALPNNSPLKATYVSAKGRNAFSAFSSASDEVFVENIPYESTAASGPHGNSVVCKTTLGGKHTLVDFDDADTAVIGKVVDALRKRGIAKIDAFVVPHHGSAYHDIEPILALKPTTAVITVNPSNRYGHPAPEILLRLMQDLKPENVLFTGSKGRVMFDPNGVKEATYTAASRDSYALFVAPNRLRAEAKGKAADVELYAKIESMMMGDPGAPPSAPAVVSLDDPEMPGSGGAAALVEDRIKATGTALSADFDIGSIPNEGLRPEDQVPNAALPALTSAAKAQNHLVLADDSGTAPELQAAAAPPSNLVKVVARQIAPATQLTSGQPVKMEFVSSTGFSNGLIPPRTLTPLETKTFVPALKSALNTPGIPNGGMVFLDGGRLFPVGPAGRLAGGTLDLCGAQFCIAPAAAGAVPFALPFTPNPLFGAVWTRVYQRRVEAFYLSINPTRHFLSELSERFDRLPDDRLRYGTGTPPPEYANNEVVTAGDIDGTEIGQILWKADVAFKSASLGRNTLTGAPLQFTVPRSLVRQDASQDEDLTTAEEDRWCRLYWTSGSQRVVADAESHRVSFEGEAIEARAEPMRLSNGKLVEYPSGAWCSGPKQVAQKLQDEANKGIASFPELVQLRQVAQTQAFAKWARDNGIRTSKRFQDAIAKVGPAASPPVPSWTSGIRSKNVTLIQPEERLAARPWTVGLHISVANPLDVAGCVAKYYGHEARAAAFLGAGLKLEDGVWRYTDQQKTFFTRWIARVAGEVAACASGTPLPPDTDMAGLEEGLGSEGSIGSTVYHLQPVHIHGGVLLGSEKATRRAEWLRDGRVVLPDGRLVLRRQADDIHFWSFSEDSGELGRLGQHVVISKAKIADIEAVEGRLRVLVETGAGGVIRQELRVSKSPGRPQGAEWVEARHADDSLIASKGIWTCNPDQHPASAVCVSDVDAAGFGEMLAVTEDEPPILIRWLAPNLWLVDIDVETVGQALDRKLAAIPKEDTGGRFALLGEYADWGYNNSASELQTELENATKGESEDFILNREYNPREIFEEQASLAGFVAETLDAGDAKESPGEFLRDLQLPEKLAKGVPASLLTDMWKSLDRAAEEAVQYLKDGPYEERLLKLKEHYSDLAVRSQALEDGANNPWQPNQ